MAGVTNAGPQSSSSSPQAASAASCMEKGERRRTGKFRRSCESCRALKLRCITSALATRPGDKSPCKRCLQNGDGCVFEQALSRQVVAKPKSRLKAVQQKIDGLLDLLSTRDEAEIANNGVQNPGVARIRTAFPVSEPRPRSVDIDSELAQELLDKYLASSTHFPFILITPGAGADKLRRSQPLLVLAIMTITTEGQLQRRLEEDFLRRLAECVIVRGEKSLDIISSIVVYLAWNHQYFDPKRQQLYQLSQMAVSMAIDLKLDEYEGITHWRSPFDSLETFHPAPDLAEKIRIYLGTYYVSSVICHSLRKPSALKQTENTEALSQFLSDLSGRPSDVLISHLIRSQKIVEDISEFTSDYEGKRGGVQVMDSARIQTTVRLFEREAEQFFAAIPSQIGSRGLLRLSYLHIKTLIYEIGFYTPLHIWAAPQASRCCDWCASSTRNDIVVSCIRAAQCFIQEYVAQTDSELHQATLFEEARVMYAILALSMAVVGQATAKLDTAGLRELTDIGTYLNLLERRLDKLVEGSEGQESGVSKRSREYFLQMRQVIRHSLVWYGQRAAGEREFDEHIGCSEKVGVELSITRLIGVEPLLADDGPQYQAQVISRQELPHETRAVEEQGMWTELGIELDDVA